MTLEKKFQNVVKILTEKTLPTHDFLFSLTDSVSNILENEKKSYRPYSRENVSGSLIDFHNSSVPVIIIPDIHARPFFLLNILQYKLPFYKGKTVFEALNSKKVRLVCVGDILHSERNTKERWLAAKVETDSGVFTGPALTSEMLDGLSALCGFFKLKEMFPEFVHILKGNHENIFNATGEGDFSFRKYADEGQMVKNFMQEYYGDDIVYMIHCVERVLPLVFVGKKCIVSHAEPEKFYTKQQIINARLEHGVVEGLTWTDNNEAEENSVQNIISELSPSNDVLYFAGHRPVIGDYEFRQNGKFIQIHNPTKQNICFVDNKKKFDVENDIYEVSK